MTQPRANRRNLDTASANAAAEAREQADEYDSLFAPTPLTLDDGSTLMVPPHPDLGMLDDDCLQAYEELMLEVESYDREPDIPEQRLRDPETGNETGVVLPAQRGAVLRPYRKNGELVRPPHSVRVVQAALGETDFKRLREGGRSSAAVWRIWSKQGLEIRERQNKDAKSDGDSLDLAPVPATDS